MVGYKLSKNDWVTPFFVIFRSVREILLVTVFCKHPVAHGPPCSFYIVIRTNYPPARLFIDEKENCVKRSSVLDNSVASGVELEAERRNILVKLVTGVDLEMII